jgi:hypothetical protein
MPFNEMFLPLVLMAFPQAKLVLLRRDHAGCCRVDALE